MIFSYVFQREKRQMDSEESGGGIRLARIELDLTQTQLAQRINAKQKSISRYETGASSPSIKTLVEIAKVLKKPAGYFLGVRRRSQRKLVYIRASKGRKDRYTILSEVSLNALREYYKSPLDTIKGGEYYIQK